MTKTKRNKIEKEEQETKKYHQRKRKIEWREITSHRRRHIESNNCAHLLKVPVATFAVLDATSVLPAGGLGEPASSPSVAPATNGDARAQAASAWNSRRQAGQQARSTPLVACSSARYLTHSSAAHPTRRKGFSFFQATYLPTQYY